MFWGGSAATSGGIDAANEQLARVSSTSPLAAHESNSGRQFVAMRGGAGRVKSTPLDVSDSRLSVLEPGRGDAVADASPAARERWHGRYRAVLIVTDLVTATLAAAIGYLARFGTAGAGEGRAVDVAFGILLPLAWVGAIGVNRAYEDRFVGVGAAEFERLVRAFLHLTVATVFVSYLFKIPVARGYVVAALPLAFALDIFGRYGARKWLHGRRARGRYVTSVLAVGGAASVAEFTALLRHDRHAGMRVVGACLPTKATPEHQRKLQALGVPLLGGVDEVVAAARTCGARRVAVLSGGIDAQKLRWISWQLEGTDTDLVVSPGLTEVGGRRLHIQPVAGLPLLHVDEPEFTGFRRMLKGAFDRVLAGLALIVLAPVLIAIAIAVRLSGPGPALFVQTRIGRNGRTFRMVKFRSMCVDAEAQRVELIKYNESAGPLFKIRADPRITSVGRVLRRFSLDELPQLINVVTGAMSLVGPRPPLPDEVSQYRDDARRRLLVKPGLTGLWQISGRSDLSWEESVRLDLRYVENWSLALDMVVLWKTARAVLKTQGAY